MAIQTVNVSNSATTVYTSTNNTAITYLALTNATAAAVEVDINLYQVEIVLVTLT